MSEEKKREKFKIDPEAEDFKPIGAFKLTTSAELGSLANEIFRNVFARIPSKLPQFCLLAKSAKLVVCSGLVYS